MKYKRKAEEIVESINKIVAPYYVNTLNIKPGIVEAPYELTTQDITIRLVYDGRNLSNVDKLDHAYDIKEISNIPNKLVDKRNIKTIKMTPKEIAEKKVLKQHLDKT